MSLPCECGAVELAVCKRQCQGRALPRVRSGAQFGACPCVGGASALGVLVVCVQERSQRRVQHVCYDPIISGHATGCQHGVAAAAAARPAGLQQRWQACRRWVMRLRADGCTYDRHHTSHLITLSSLNRSRVTAHVRRSVVALVLGVMHISGTYPAHNTPQTLTRWQPPTHNT
jgi:hypothetical protein